MKRRKKTTERRAVDLLEEAVHLLRTVPRVAFGWYLLGTLPFALGLLYFWTDMSRGAFAAEHCTEAALGVALLFVWAKLCQTIFSTHLLEHLRHRDPEPLDLRRLTRAALFQAAIQPAKLFVLPIAAIITVPFGWTFAFFENVSVLGSEETASGLLEKARRQATLWPGQNHLALSLVMLFMLAVFINLGLLLFATPHLLKMLFGIETVFTLGGTSMLNTTFFAVLTIFTWVSCDPLVKAIYALRCFYGESLRSGEDLRVQLRELTERASAPQWNRAAAALVLAFFLIASPASTLRAQQSQPTTSAAPAQRVQAPELDRAISDTIDRPEFSWRLPREQAESSIEKKMPFFGSLERWLKSMFRSFGRLIRKLIDWLERRSANATPDLDEHESSSWLKSSRTWFIACIVIVAGALTLIIVKIIRERRRAPREVTAQIIGAKEVDLTDEAVSADQLPENEWLEMARNLIAKNELRLGLRALFLAGLAHLGQREIVTLAKYKSNREYERELRRRAADRPPLQTAFSQNVAMIERVWYGNHEVTGDTVQRASDNLDQIRAQ